MSAALGRTRSGADSDLEGRRGRPTAMVLVVPGYQITATC